MLVGDGPLRESVLDQLKSLDLFERVTYLGLRNDIYIDCIVYLMYFIFRLGMKV